MAENAANSACPLTAPPDGTFGKLLVLGVGPAEATLDVDVGWYRP